MNSAVEIPQTRLIVSASRASIRRFVERQVSFGSDCTGMTAAILRQPSLFRNLMVFRTGIGTPQAARAGIDDLVPHLLQHDHAAERVWEQRELSDAAEVDERACVGDDDHRDSSVATSFFRSSTE